MNTSLMNPSIDHIIASEQHLEAVKRFNRHFRIASSHPSLALLKAILKAFSVFPYENLSKIIRLSQFQQSDVYPIRLPEAIMEDHLEHRLGGTCFSLTFFLETILLSAGFDCYPIMADMRAGPNVHCALITLLDGRKLLVDPGYVLSQTMALDPDKPRLYHSEFTGIEIRFDARQEKYDLFTFNKLGAKWRYRFSDVPVSKSEFHQHWQTSFQRNGMNGLCLSRSKDEKLIFVHKDFMRITSPDGKQNFNIKSSLHKTINEQFGIDQAYIERALSALDANLKVKFGRNKLYDSGHR